MQLLKKVPETVWLFVLCCCWRYLPLQLFFTFDSREEWLAVTIVLQSIFCAAVFCASESRWRAAIIGIEIINIFYSVGVTAHWDLRDNLCDYRPIFIQLSFILQLLFISMIAGGGDGNQHRVNNRRKSDRPWDIGHHNSVIERLFIHTGNMEAQK